MGRTERFIHTSGLYVEVLDLVTCTSTGEAIGVQQLLINVTSVELHNRTAVQCHASRKSAKYPNVYSVYGLVLVDHIDIGAVYRVLE